MQFSASMPMYQQIADTLRREIVSQRYAPGSSIGSQGELAERFCVSLITIKKAIRILENECLVVSRQGKGTFVQEALLQEGGGSFTCLSSTFKKQNLNPTIVIKTMKEISTPHTLPRNILDILGAKCIYVERTHNLDQTVVGFTKIYIPVKIGCQITSQELTDTSLYHLCQSKLGYRLGRAIQTIRAEKANEKIAEMLRVPEDTPLLYFNRESYSEDGQLLEYAERFFEYTQCSFRVELNISDD